MQTKVSIIIPVYNVELYIEQCIRSIMNQDYKNIEIIVVNDGSPDNSQAIIDKLAKKDTRIISIVKENGGVSSARNEGIRKASGEYLMFVDGDDYLANDAVGYMLRFVTETNTKYGVLLDCFNKSEDKQTEKEYIEVLNSDDATALLLSPRIIVGSWNKIYERKLITENNISFREDLFYGEGLNFITTLAQLTDKIVVSNRKVYYYRRNNYSSATTKFNINAMHNGEKSIDIIEENLKTKAPQVTKMLNWHRCQFKMGVVVRILEARKKEEYKQYYKECLSYVRKHTLPILATPNISFYKKGLLIGCCIFPEVLARLDKIRRSKIAKQSVK